MKQALLHTDVIVSGEQLVLFARQLLERAEQQRREGQQTFDAAPLKDQLPSLDWAGAGLLISQAMGHLDEALPNGQKDRTAAALGALRLGVKLLELNLHLRGVNPAMITLVQPDSSNEPNQ
jgi:hypothetical protein